MLGIKRRYIALVGLAATGWAASHFVSISGIENIRLTAKSLNSGAENLNEHASGSSFGDANNSTPMVFNSYRVAPQKVWNETGSNLFQTAANTKLDPRSSHTAGSKALDSKAQGEGLGVKSTTPRIRVASFNLHAFNEQKLQKVPVIETLVRIIRQFDVIALQHISSRQTDLLPVLTDRVNQSDRRYDFLIGPPVGREQKQQFAFLFDTERIETDRGQLYTVDDPQDLLTYEPLVAWFRTTLPQRSQSFTFSIANVRLNPLSGESELRLLPDLVRGIRNDGRLEDDVLLAGEFMASSDQLAKIPGLEMFVALDGVPTTVNGDAMTGNILFPTRATDEFTGKSGVIDFLRQLNLSFDQASQVSSNLPIWAEFTAYEGGKPQ
jgi:deoxyribonuclease-1-like protein